MVNGRVGEISQYLERKVEEIETYDRPQVEYEPDDELLNNAKDDEFRPARYDSSQHKIILGPSIPLEVCAAPRKKTRYIAAHESGHAASHWIEKTFMPDIENKGGEKPIDTDKYDRFDLYTQMWKSIHSEQFAEAFKRSFLNDYGDDSRVRKEDDEMGIEKAKKRDGNIEPFWEEGDDNSLEDLFKAVERESLAVITGMKSGGK